MSLTADLDTQLVDVTRMPLSKLRTVCDPLLLEAMRRLVENVPLSDHDEIQEPGRRGSHMTDS
ncbi:MAG TPA: hypothetical protein VF892_07895 [Pseudonocardiaceae bacterium]